MVGASKFAWINIGSDVSCDIKVVGVGVAPVHVRAALDPKGRLVIQDLGSGGSCGKNAPDALFAAEQFETSDTLFLGASAVPASEIYDFLRSFGAGARRGNTVGYQGTAQYPPVPLHSSQRPPAAPHGVLSFELPEGLSIIGRGPNSSIHLDHPMVSNEHAVILRSGDTFRIRDAGSTLGTFVDGRQVGKRLEPLHPGDIIGIAAFRLLVRPAAAGAETPEWVRQALPHTSRSALFVSSFLSGVEIRANSLVSAVGKRNRPIITLEGVRLCIQPGQLVALMGASGSGKTTLLRMLAGQSAPHSGSVTFNEEDLYCHFDELRSVLGYVPQEDVMHTQLTVREALYYAARLRLPSDYSDADLHQRISAILDQLGIRAQQDLRIGSAEQRGISGGQKKRVNLAMELIPDPAVLLLDEPTSGLASTDAERVVETLLELARNDGKTIVVTIHTPPPYVFRLFDTLAVVDNHTTRLSPPPAFQPGRLVYFGPGNRAAPFFQTLDSSGSSNGYDGADAVLEAIESNPGKTTTDWNQAYEASPIYQQYVEKPLSSSRSDSRPASVRQALPDAWRQFRTLCHRLWRIKTGDLGEVRSLVIQPLVIGFLIAIMTKRIAHGDREFLRFVNQTGKCLFLTVITAQWFGCNNSVREIVGELAIYLRERSAGLSIAAYLFSKIVAFTVIVGVQTFLLFAVIYLIVGLQMNFIAAWAILWFSSVVGVSLGLFLSASARTTQWAIQAVPLVLLPMIIFGGGVTRLDDLGSVQFLSAFIPARWAFFPLILLEQQSNLNFKGPAADGKATDLLHFYFKALSTTQHLIRRTAQDHFLHLDLPLSMGILALMATLFLVGAAIQLKRKDIR